MARRNRKTKLVERVQTGVRLEKRMLKVLKGTAEYLDISLGELLESMVLHAFDGKNTFGEETRGKISQLKTIYGMDFGSELGHGLYEKGEKTTK